jgi:hypothetical protein
MQPLRLPIQDGGGLRGEIGLTIGEKNAVADIDYEILRSARARSTCDRVTTAKVVVGARAHGQSHDQYGGNLDSLNYTH